MERVVRNRKAFDEKENDHKHLNKKPSMLASLNYKAPEQSAVIECRTRGETAASPRGAAGSETGRRHSPTVVRLRCPCPWAAYSEPGVPHKSSP